MLNTAFDLLICDCDGVLIDSESVAHRVLLEKLQTEIPTHDIALLTAGKHGLLTAVLLDQVADESGWVIPPGFREKIIAEITAAVHDDAEPIADVASALAAIPLPKAVASNSQPHHIDHAIARGGLQEIFKGHLFSARQVERPKPYPDLYLHVAKAFGAEPSRCLVIEDSIPGATAALAAGMTVIGFVGASHIDDAHIDALRQLGVAMIVERMVDLPAAVRQLARAATS